MCECLGGKPQRVMKVKEWEPVTGGTTDRPWLAIGLSKSRYVGTRKMVNYA